MHYAKEKRCYKTLSNIIDFNSYRNITGVECGTITICVYKDTRTGYPFFFIEPDNEDLSPIVDVLDDTLKQY